MKNKNKYDLRQLEFAVHHRINGCGKKIISPVDLDILYEKKRIKRIKEISAEPIKYVMEWLESEEE